MLVTATVVATLPELASLGILLHRIFEIDVLPEVVVRHLILGLICTREGAHSRNLRWTDYIHNNCGRRLTSSFGSAAACSCSALGLERVERRNYTEKVIDADIKARNETVAALFKRMEKTWPGPATAERAAAGCQGAVGEVPHIVMHGAFTEDAVAVHRVRVPPPAT